MYPGKHAVDRGDQAALIMEPSGRKMTFAEFDANANRLAHLFRQAGLRRGDHVAILMENNLRYCEVMSGAERTGLYYTCVNSFLTAPEVAYIVDDCDAKVLVTSVAKSDVAITAASLTPQVSMFLCVDATAQIGPFLPYDAALSSFPPTPVSDEQLGAAMLYSSGTTGRPKGILRPLPDFHPREQLPVMTFTQQLLGMREGMVYLSPAPTYHSAPQASIATALRLGSTCVIMERFDAALPAASGAAQGDPFEHGSDHVQSSVEAPRRGPNPLRRVLAGSRRAQRCAMPGSRQKSHDRVVGPNLKGVLRVD